MRAIEYLIVGIILVNSGGNCLQHNFEGKHSSPWMVLTGCYLPILFCNYLDVAKLSQPDSNFGFILTHKLASN